METVTTYSYECPNGDIILGYSGEHTGMFFVKTSDGIFEYSKNEIEEIYGSIPTDLRKIGEKTP